MKIQGINHVGLVVKDEDAAEAFYIGILGLERHPKVESWLILNENCRLHLINIPEAEATDSLYHEVQHFALQVPDVKQVNSLLISHDLKPFQMDFEGNTRDVTSATDALEFGIGTLFVTDPDGNLIEFVQLGRGAFSETM